MACSLWLLRWQIDAKYENKAYYGQTAAHLCALKQETELFHMLVLYGADVVTPMATGLSDAHIAFRAASLPCLGVLGVLTMCGCHACLRAAGFVAVWFAVASML